MYNNNNNNNKQGFVYILTNKRNGTLYIGVTSNLYKRIYEHKIKMLDGFTKEYDLNKLVYYEVYDNILTAIKREKELKKYKRNMKLKLINNFNKNWDDLYDKALKN